jgi:mannose-1-phosphate guanylyltransferase
MQAVVLAGGEGTRLRPLTLTKPKPAIPLVDRPFIRFMLDWLGRHGVAEVIMACGFRADDLREALGDEVSGGPAIRYLEEPEPLGTAGPIRLAADEGLLGERFLVLNGDLLTDLDLTAHLAAHEERGAVASLALHPVDNPSHYGLVRRTEDGAVTGFLEKPDASEIDTDEVNAGAYVLERPVVDLIPPGRSVSIERDVFPRLVGQGLYGLRLESYWMDIGTPERYLQASWDILTGAVETEVGARMDGTGIAISDDARVGVTAVLEAPVLVDSSADVAGGVIGPRAIVGAGCEIADGVRISGSVLHPQCRVGADASIEGAILGAGVEVGARATIGQGSVLGEGARVEPGAVVESDARLEPGAFAA